MRCAILTASLDPWAELARHQQDHPDLATATGALNVFVGQMRDLNLGDGVTGMTLEHYPGMTERFIERISAEAAERWPLLDSLVLHRVGDLDPGEPIVLIAVWSAHRAVAYEASRYLIEELKHRAPFWKKERLGDGGDRWVVANTAG